MGDSLWTFGFEVANFLTLAVLLAWLFFKPVRKAIHDQQQAIEDQVNQAAQKLADADKQKADLEDRERKLHRDLEDLRAKAVETAQQEADRILAEGRQKLAQERDDMRREALTLSQSQTGRLAHVVTQVAQQMVQRLLTQANGPQLEQLLLNAALVELRSRSDQVALPMTVESAMPLTSSQQDQIKQLVPQAANQIRFVEHPELVGGVRIQTSQGLIDASITGLATFCEQELQRKINTLLSESTAHE